MSKKRRQFTAAFKLEVVRGEKPIAQLCRAREITDKLYYQWREQFLERAPNLFARGG